MVKFLNYLRATSVGLASLGAILTQVQPVVSYFPKAVPFFTVACAVVYGLSTTVHKVLDAMNASTPASPQA